MFDWGAGLRSSCPFVMFRFGSRAVTGFRLRWLSEWGRCDRGRFVLRWMLKRVSNSGGEWGQWLDKVRHFCHTTTRGLRLLSPSFLWEAHLAPMGRTQSGLEALPTTTQRLAAQRPPPEKNPDRNQAQTSQTPPELEPTSASPGDQCRHDRDNPAPIIIEAGISSSPVSQSGTRRSDRKIRNRNPMPDTKPPDPFDQHRCQLPPVKRIFGYFFCNRKKSLASASAAGGETAFEVEVEIESRPHPAKVPLSAHAERPLESKLKSAFNSFCRGKSEKKESACKPGSVENSHSSGTAVTSRLEQPTRMQRGPRRRIPIWPCFEWGLPCRRRLPATRCALTAPFHPYRRSKPEAVCFLWHFP